MMGRVWMFVITAYGCALLLPTTYGAKPTFEPAAQIPAALLDDSPPGTFYYKFTAKDPQSLNIIYSLDNNIKECLQINPDTGNTTVKKKIDREAITFVKFKVFATNTNNEQAELETFLIITDVNNKPPIMTNVPYTKNIAEDTPIDTTVYTITIDDKDDGIFAKTDLTINSGNEAGAFRLKLENIVINNSLDYDNGVRQYVLNITAKNTQPPFPETSGVITINVLNVDDQGLKFLQNIYEGQVIKGSSVNTPIVRVQARDLDSLNETIEYKIYPGSDPGNLYAINTNTGQIAVNNAGLEIGSQMLVVMAVSKKHCSALTLVNVTVVAVPNVKFQASIVEGQVNTVVMDLTTTETSFNVTGASFSIESGNYGNHFEIETTNLKVGSIPLDRKIRSDYSLVIKLEKGGVVQGMATVNVIVKEDLVKEDLPIGS